MCTHMFEPFSFFLYKTQISFYIVVSTHFVICEIQQQSVYLSATIVADWRSFASTGKIFVCLLHPARKACRDFVFRRRVSSSGRYISSHGYWAFGRSAADSVSHGWVVDSTGRKAIGRTVTNVRLSSVDDFRLVKTTESAMLNSCGSDLG